MSRAAELGRELARRTPPISDETAQLAARILASVLIEQMEQQEIERAA